MWCPRPPQNHRIPHVKGSFLSCTCYNTTDFATATGICQVWSDAGSGTTQQLTAALKLLQMFEIFSKTRCFKLYPGPTKVILAYFYLSQPMYSPVFEGRIILNSSYCSTECWHSVAGQNITSLSHLFYHTWPCKAWMLLFQIPPCIFKDFLFRNSSAVCLYNNNWQVNVINH